MANQQQGIGSQRAPLAKKTMPSKSLEAVADTWAAVGAVDVTGDWDNVGADNFGSSDRDDTTPGDHIEENSPADPTFAAHATNAFLPGFPAGD